MGRFTTSTSEAEVVARPYPYPTSGPAEPPGGSLYAVLLREMPRPNLPRAQPLVHEFCIRRDLPYCETGLIDSYTQALRHLNTVGHAPHRTPTH